MEIRDRVKKLVRVRAGDLIPHEGNWRRHGEDQRRGLSAILENIGYTGALVAREGDDGGLVLIDGHLRAETTPDAEVPVLVVDLSAEEAEQVLATYDAIGSMADTDTDALAALLEGLDEMELGDSMEELLQDVRDITGVASLVLETQTTEAAHTPDDGHRGGVKDSASDIRVYPLHVPRERYNDLLGLYRDRAEAKGYKDRDELMCEVLFRAAGRWK